MWVDGSKPLEKIVDYNKLFRETLKGELSDEVARKTLGKFLMTNLGFLVRILTGFILEPYQRIMIKGWLAKNFTLTVAGRGFSKCIDEDATVLTENGFKPIKNVFVGEKIWADKGFQEIEKRIDNSKENGFEIETAGGYKCKGKIGHKIKYLDTADLTFKWKNIEDFDGSETIPIRYGMDRWGNNSPFKDYDFKFKQFETKINPIDEPDFYYWMGLITGDGCLRGNKSSIGITTEDREIYESTILAIKRYMPDSSISISNRNINNNNLKSIITYSTAMRRFFTYLGMEENKLAHEKKFPIKLLSANKENICSYIKGLYDTDGHAGLTYDKDHNRWTCRIGYVSTSYDLIKNVHTILLNLGITASIDKCHIANDESIICGKKCKTRDAWRITIFDYQSIINFNKSIGFNIQRKQEKIHKYLTNASSLIIYGGGLISGTGNFFRKKYRPNHFRNSNIKYKLYNSCSIGRLKQILQENLLDEEDTIKVKEVVEGNYYFDDIKSITACITKTIDIQVANESCYWSDGFINHNSFIASHFAYLYCILNPGKHIIVVSATFRSSRRIVENIDDWSKRKASDGHPGGVLLRQTIDGEMTKKPDLYKIKFKNGASIIALPLGDPNRLRGFRANVVILDEGLLIPQPTIDNVLKPFLFTPSSDEITRKQRIREREDRLIAAGKMKEEERMKFKSHAKMIILSSASYSWESLFDLYKKYLSIIYKQDDQAKRLLELIGKKSDEDIAPEIIEESPASYLVHQLSWKVARADLVEASVREEIESGMFSESTIKREYEAQFVQDSDGYFRAAKMEECTIKDGEDPCVEIVGEAGAEYVLGIDQNVSDSETADHFAMCLLKIVEKKMADGTIKKIGMVVHQYAEVAVGLREHIEYLYYLISHFNIVYIAYDASQGKSLGFINICNESELFKEKKIELKHIIADFGKENYDEIVKQVQKGYNKGSGMIVQPQSFHSDFQRAANEYLQACFDRQHIFFAGKARASATALISLRERDVGSILRNHSSFTETLGTTGDKDEFIIQQDNLLDLVKKECALIEVKASALGNISYDIPSHMKRSSKNRNRVRKDNYSALLLANWAVKIYLEAQDRPRAEVYQNFIPYLV